MSNVIKGILDIDVSVLMGANIASEVAKEDFCEATIGKLFIPNTNFPPRKMTMPSFKYLHHARLMGSPRTLQQVATES